MVSNLSILKEPIKISRMDSIRIILEQPNTPIGLHSEYSQNTVCPVIFGHTVAVVVSYIVNFV